eukprot:Hpha_TRINITY_DN15587_c0_g1::TRINITY_DN15587_c0_g1_i1::g.108442::m.108442/K03292/TC.GPH; glycoside/pentoside/hexuronide:cation symporter, GPH family
MESPPRALPAVRPPGSSPSVGMAHQRRSLLDPGGMPSPEKEGGGTTFPDPKNEVPPANDTTIPCDAILTSNAEAQPAALPPAEIPPAVPAEQKRCVPLPELIEGQLPGSARDSPSQPTSAAAIELGNIFTSSVDDKNGSKGDIDRDNSGDAVDLYRRESKEHFTDKHKISPHSTDHLATPGLVWEEEPPSGKLPLSTKVILGIGESVQATYVVIGGFFLNLYLLEVACMQPRVVGLIQLISGLWDSFNDPTIGRLSDRTNTRWGRRRPWLLGASVPLGAVYFGFWNTLPEGTGEAVKFVYYLIMYMGISAGITAVQVQVGSLAPELTDDYDERTSLSTFRLGVGNIIALVFVAVHGGIVSAFEDDKATGYRVSGALVGCVLTLNSIITFACVREKYKPKDHTADPIGCTDGLKAVFQVKPFLWVVCIYLFGPVGILLVQTNLLMYCKYVLLDEDLAYRLVVVVFGIGLICVPGWNILAQRVGKKTTYYIGATTTGCAILFLTVLTHESRAAAYPIAAFTGAGLIVPYLMPYSMLPDVIEEDEWKTGERREGIFFGFFTIFLKLAVTVALSVTNIILGAAGYEKPQSSCGVPTTIADTQSDSVIFVLRLLVGPVPAASLAIAVFAAWRYPITRTKHEEMLRALGDRKAFTELRPRLQTAALCLTRKGCSTPPVAQTMRLLFAFINKSAPASKQGGLITALHHRRAAALIWAVRRRLTQRWGGGVDVRASILSFLQPRVDAS